MVLRIDGNWTKPVEPKPVPKHHPKTHALSPSHNNVSKTADMRLLGANNRLKLERKFSANQPTPGDALNKINQLPQPNAKNTAAIKTYKEQRSRIAEDAVKNSTPPKFEDFRRLGLNGATASMEYRDALSGYNSQIGELKKISAEAKTYPDKILSPGEAATAINDLPRPDRNNSAEIKDYNQKRADVADAALMYKSEPPKREDFKFAGNPRFADLEFREASANYSTNLSQLKDYSSARYSQTPPPMNDAEADKAASDLIQKHGGATDENQAFAVGQELAKLSRTKPNEAILVMNKVQAQLNGTEKGDNAASGFIDSLTDGELENLAQTSAGKQMLTDLKPHLLTGDVHDSERRQADRIDSATMSQNQKIEAAKQKIETAYKDKGAVEAAKVLREETEKLSPEAAASILRKVKPTTDKIIADLNDKAKSADGSYGYDINNIKEQIEFDSTLADLSAAVGRASQSPNGKEIVKQFAAPIAEFIKENGVARYDEALGKTIALGGGAELSVEVINQLQAAGKTDEADDILQNVEDGVKELKGNLHDSLEDYGKASEEFQWLTKNWGPMMDKGELENAIAGYMKDHPEVNEKFANLDRLTGSAVRTLNSLDTLPDAVKSLDHYDDVRDAAEELGRDEKTQSLITTMPGATREFANLVKLQTEGEPTLLDGIKEKTGLIGDVKGFGEKMSNVLLKATVSSAIEAKLAGDTKKATQVLDNLKSYGKLFGVSDADLKKIIDGQPAAAGKRAVAGLKDIQAATSAADAEAKLSSLNEDFKVGAFAAEQPLGQAFRGAGILLSLPGTIDSIKNIDNPLDAAKALTDAAGLGRDSAELFAGVIKNAKVTGFVESAGFEAAGKVLGVVGLVFNGISLIDDLTGKDKDVVNAGFDLATLGGGAAVLFAGGPVTLGIGAVVLLGASIGKFIYGNTKEANKHENGTTEKFLRDGGVNPDVTQGLSDQDGDGRSPAPVFKALAKELGVKPQEFLDYLSTLSADKVRDLVGIAHKVDPNDDGNYPVSKEQPRYGGRFPMIDNTPNDLKDLAKWMKDNGYNAPGI